MKVKGIMNYKESQLNVHDCNIEKVVVLSEQEYRHFRANMGKKYDFIAENWKLMYADSPKGEVSLYHCLLVMGEDSEDF